MPEPMKAKILFTSLLFTSLLFAAEDRTQIETPSSKSPAPKPAAEEVFTDIDISSSILRIENADGSATAFLGKFKEKCFVVTNIHVLPEDGKMSVRTLGGEEVPIGNVGFAADGRDLYIMPLGKIPKDAKPLPIAFEDFSANMKVGDELLLCGDALGEGVFRNSHGKLLGLGPRTMEVSNVAFHGNSGSPILHVKSGMVVGVLARGVNLEAVDKTDEHAKNSRENSNSPLKGKMRYFSERLDTVKKWNKLSLKEYAFQCRKIEHFTLRVIAIEKFRKSKYKEAMVLENFPELGKIFDDYHRDVHKAKAYRELCEKMSKLIRHDIAMLKMTEVCEFLKKEKSEILREYQNFYDFFEAESKGGY